MIEVLGKIAEIIFLSEMLMFTGVLLFRKSKGWKGTRLPDHRSTKYAGIYLVVSAIALLIGNHFVSYTSYLSYFMDLFINTLIFYTGVKALVN